MNSDQIRDIVIEELRNIAPESDPAAIDPKAGVREALDIDSMDFLNYIIALHRRLKIDIPEIDYPALQSIAGATAYLAAKLSG